jgi:hypothetical protein
METKSNDVHIAWEIFAMPRFCNPKLAQYSDMTLAFSLFVSKIMDRVAYTVL